MDMFSAQLNKNQSQDKCASSAPSLAIFPTKHEVKETKLESQTLNELLRLKTVQMDKQGHVLDHKPNLYRRH